MRLHIKSACGHVQEVDVTTMQQVRNYRESLCKTCWEGLYCEETIPEEETPTIPITIVLQIPKEIDYNTAADEIELAIYKRMEELGWKYVIRPEFSMPVA